MKPKGYQITEPIPEFAEGDVLNVTERYRPWHRNEMMLELIGSSPGSKTVIVTEDAIGFSERGLLDATARFGDWHTYCRTFDAGGEILSDATETDGLVRITPESLSAIAEPMAA